MLRVNNKRKRSPSFFESNKHPRVNVEPELIEVVVEPQSASFVIPDALDRGQDLLLNKINDYLALKGRPLFSTEGYCFGLALVWLQKISEGRVDWFYQTRDKILVCPTRHFEDIEMEVEKFLALIEWGQNSRDYLNNVDHTHLDIILEDNSVESGPFIGSDENLSSFLRSRRGVRMYMVCGNNHAVAIYQSDEKYYLFDSNNALSKAEIVYCRHEVARKILYCLYTVFNEPVPGLLNLTVARIQSPLAFKTKDEGKECHHANKNDIISDDSVYYNPCVIL